MEEITKKIEQNELFDNKLETISMYFSKITRNSPEALPYKRNLIDNQKISNLNTNIIYLKNYHNDDYECVCLDIYFNLTNNLPIYSNLLIYDEETIEEEILSFIFRVKKCKIQSLFMLILSETIFSNDEKKLKYLFDLIKKYIYNKNNKSILVILYPNKNNQIIENIQNYEFLDKKYVNKRPKIKENISIILSDTCGSGKTYYIRSNKKENEEYIHFPLGGYLDKINIINKLKEIKIEEIKTYIIHIDLYDTIFDKILKDFLFKFLILKYYGYNDRIFSYNSNKIKIKIELPNTHINYINKYKILDYFEDENFQNVNFNDIPYKNKIEYLSKKLKKYCNNNINDDDNKIINDKLIANIKKNIGKITKVNINEYHPNFYQKNIFINFLYSELKKLFNCYNLDPDLVVYEKENKEPCLRNLLNDLRKDIIESLIDNSIYFTFTSFDNIINNKLNLLDENENYNNIIKDLEKEGKKHIIKYDDIEPSILAFHDEGQNFSIIATNKDDQKFGLIKKYLDLLNNFCRNSYNNRKKKYKNIEYKESQIVKIPKELEKEGKLLDELLKIITVDEGIIKKLKEVINQNIILNSYVFTNDNFVKMYLLIMRINAEIPTIIMGETGCGKTRLLQMFSFLYNFRQEYIIKNGNFGKIKDFADFIWILRFNSATTEKDIIDFINNINKRVTEKEKEEMKNILKIFDENWNLEYNKWYENIGWMNWIITFKFINKPKKENIKYSKEQAQKDYKDFIENRKIIILLDEINTCNCLGFIKQILCDEKVRDKYNITKRFVFICTCNPYKFINDKFKNLYNYRKLIYTVNPLPNTLLNFVLDFQDLTKETTEKYIEKMIDKMIGNNKYFNVCKILLTESHFYIKDNSDNSSISLREIDRYGKIYNFFKKYLKDRNEYDKHLQLSEDKILKDSIVLSLYFCYYMRLETEELRNRYLDKLNSIRNDLDFMGVIERESSFITDQVLENILLKENLFCEFICVINKEPLILVGKPGLGKSLSIRLLINAMKGKDSKNKFLEKYGEIIPSFYQCSEASTPYGVQDVFKRAKKK